MARSTDRKLTYEQAMAQLEQIIEDIESGDAGLERTLTAYEQGVKLIGHCRAILDRVENRLAELQADENGNLKPVDASAAEAAEAEEPVLEAEEDEVDEEDQADIVKD
jgi:exodeoxyribonuclease VII small subunit